MDKLWENSLIFGVYDVFTSLIPGSIFLTFLYVIYPEFFKYNLPSFLLLPSYIIYSLTAGFIFLNIGNYLYSSFYHYKDFQNGSIKFYITKILHKMVKILVGQDYQSSGIDLRDKIKKKTRKLYNITNLDNLGVFQLADILALKENGNFDRNNLLAKEGLIRSLSSMIILVSIILILDARFNNYWIQILIFYVVLQKVFLYGHNYFKKIRQSQIFISAFIYLQNKSKEVNDIRDE